RVARPVVPAPGRRPRPGGRRGPGLHGPRGPGRHPSPPPPALTPHPAVDGRSTGWVASAAPGGRGWRPMDPRDPIARLDTAALERWLDEHLPELGDGPLTVSKISGGSTNLVLRLQRDGEPLVARMPPLEGTPQGAKTLHREATVLAAL